MKIKVTSFLYANHTTNLGFMHKCAYVHVYVCVSVYINFNGPVQKGNNSKFEFVTKFEIRDIDITISQIPNSCDVTIFQGNIKH